MEIDNFDIIRQHLDFVDTKLDRYVVHILRRPKDLTPEYKNALGANESQRLIKTYYVDSVEYLDRKREAIIELCRANNARAYIIVQPKDNFECLLNLGQKILETIQNKNYSVKPEHLIRQAYCEWHKTRKKLWILDLDLDNDQMIEYKHTINFGGSSYWTKTWTVEEVKALIIEQLKKIQNKKITKVSENIMHPEDLVYEVPSKHGCSIVFPPINLIETQEKCGLFFEGQKIFKERKSIGPGEYEYIEHKITGWLHKDGMVNLYIPDF
jgi:hypothetical protein